MPIPISNVTRRVVYAASGTGPYAFTFEILANTDIAVYKDDALLTLTTDYTVTIASNGTGSITLVASPTGATQIAIVGNRTIQRTTDFVTGGDFFANTVNDEMDQQTIFAQQNAEGLQRALSAPQTDPTSINMTLPRASLRANKALGFDANGNPAIADTLGTNRGNWSSGVLYYVRDIIKDTTNSNIWQCIVQHTSSGSQPISTNADVAKWSLLVDAAAAATSATNAAASASAASTSASAASTSASNASSSASTASTQASNASTSATNAASSASAASSSATTASTAATNAGNSATAAATSATNASNSASAASTSASNASSSASAASTSASNASTSATNAASSASTATTQATNASNSASTASTQATNAASSATAAAASATSAAASYDSFDDRYLGPKTSNPTLDNDGNALLTGAIYFNSVANTMRVYNGTAWQDQAASPDTIAERSFAATAGQTSYTFTGGYRVGYTYVYVNGALLDTADITATDGTTITFTSALALNDEVRILSYKAIGSVAIGDISGLQTALDGKVAGAAATTTVGGDLKLYEGTNNGTNFVALKSPASLAANVTWTLPSADGTSAQVLSTNGSGTLSWATASGGGASAATPTAIGTVYGSMTSGSGSPYLTALGYLAGYLNTGAANSAVGYAALYVNTSGEDNVSVGMQSMLANTTGNGNVAVGKKALQANTSGSYNTAVGFQPMFSATTGANNTCIGLYAGYDLTTGSSNVFVGQDSGRTGSPGGSFTTQSNRVVIGNGSTSNAYVQVAWTVTSDARDKTDVVDAKYGLDFIKGLRPVEYKWDKRSKYSNQNPDGTHKEAKTQLGFLAQDVIALEKQHGGIAKDLLIADDEKDEILSITETKIIPILVKAIQELKAEFDAYKATHP
jgi:hypothetical protein